MSAIKSKNTKPEIAVRKLLHSMGYRFRLHRKDLPGSPDIVLPKYKTVIFVHGCFWHRHQNCKYASTPKTRQEFWNKKFNENINRDKINQENLSSKGWKIIILWEWWFRCRCATFSGRIYCKTKTTCKQKSNACLNFSSRHINTNSVW